MSLATWLYSLLNFISHMKAFEMPKDHVLLRTLQKKYRERTGTELSMGYISQVKKSADIYLETIKALL